MQDEAGLNHAYNIYMKVSLTFIKMIPISLSIDFTVYLYFYTV